MPGKVKVRVLAGRNLPVMDRSSDTTDAYVEIKLGNTTLKTEVYRKSLNPQWNSEWFIFEVDDSELQDEPLQIRIMDHDTYSANDAIGKVYVDLNPLLFAPTQPSQGRNTQDNSNLSGAAVMSGWLPVYDTMHGIRGEVNILVKVDLFSDFNKFRQSSCGVQFFFTACIPTGFRCNSIIGFVEELVVNDDPEYKWIDKIRTPRASNEARQTLFSKLSGELQRRIGLKVLEQGGNAVLGYRQCFDLEGESGIVVRGIGSVVSLSRVFYDSGFGTASAHSPSPHRECTQRESPQLQEPFDATKQSCGGTNQSPTHSIKLASPSRSAGIYIDRRSSDSELSITPKGGSLPGGSGGSSGSKCGLQGGVEGLGPAMPHDQFDSLIYPFLTMTSFPPGFIIHIGATVCARVVRLMDRSHPEDLMTRDSWWSDVRSEIRSHMRSLECNAILGYEEFTSISDEVCLLNAVGTAAVINVRYHELEIPYAKMSIKSPHEIISVDKKDLEFFPQQQQQQLPTGARSKVKEPQHVPVNRTHSNVHEDPGEGSSSGPATGTKALPKSDSRKVPPCTLCHLPYNEKANPFKIKKMKCQICKKGKVPDLLLSTIELPSNLPIIGRGCLIQSRVIRAKKDAKGELNAREVSEAMSFMEYDLYTQLYTKLMIKGMNAVFSLRVRVTIGKKLMVAIATGTGVFLKAYAPPTAPRIVSRIPGDDSQKTEMQKKMIETFERNKKFYGLNVPHDKSRESRSTSKGSDSDDSDQDEDDSSSAVNKEDYDLDLNDQDDVELINLLLEDYSPPPHIVAAVTSSEAPPGFNKNLQMFFKLWRLKISLPPNNILFSSHVDSIIQGVYFKLRNLSPCAISGLQMNVYLPEEDEIQVSMHAIVLGRGAPPPISPPSKLTEKVEAKSSQQEEGELMFRMEEVSEEPAAKATVKSSCSSFPSIPSTTSFTSESSKASLKIRTSSTTSQFAYVPQRSSHFGVEITPLSFIPGGSIERYLGNLNFFFIRESTSIKEIGGLSAFMGSFVAEVLGMARAHVAAIGGNALISYFLSECVLINNPHKNQAQCLINIGGDVVHVQYCSSKVDQSDATQNPSSDIAKDTTSAVFE